MKKSSWFYIFCVIGLILYIAIRFLLTTAFITFETPNQKLLGILSFLIIQIVFFGILLFRLKKEKMYFDIQYAAIEKQIELYDKSLIKLGEAPLICFFFFLSACVLSEIAGSLILNVFLNADIFKVVLISIFSSSVILLISSYIYIIYDRLVLEILLDQKVTRYPIKIKTHRQKRKNIIIPIVMSLLSIISTFSYTMIAVSAVLVNGQIPNIDLLINVVANSIPVLLLFNAIVVGLVSIWAANNEKLFACVLSRLTQISSDEKNLKERIYITSVDEIAEIEGHINIFSSVLKTSFKEVKSVVDDLTNIQKNLFSSIEDSTKNTQDIADRILLMLNLIKNEDETVKKALSAGDDLITNVHIIIEKINKQTQSIMQSTSQAEGAIEAISKAAQGTFIIRDKTNELISVFEAGGQNIRSTLDAVKTISDLSKKLNDINSIISKIASQTNLLAMNAAIEAAHAGESGKGFSVVADEIRNLAETTAKHTKDSKTSLSAILKEIAQALIVSESTENSYKVMKEIVLDVTNSTREISLNMDSQNNANQNILKSIRDTMSLTTETQEKSLLLDAESKLLIEALESLAKESNITLENSESVQKGNKAVQLSIQKLEELSTEAMDLTARADSLIGNFKV